MKRTFLFIAILFSFGLSSYAMDPGCPDGQVPCGSDHICKLKADCKGNNPPPPGLVLPIDSNIYFLLAAGLGLGIYFLGFTGEKSPVSSSAQSE
jgi:hypothetical protein